MWVSLLVYCVVIPDVRITLRTTREVEVCVVEG